MLLMLNVGMTVIGVWAHVVREDALVRLLVGPDDWTVMLGRIGTQAHRAGAHGYVCSMRLDILFWK